MITPGLKLSKKERDAIAHVMQNHDGDLSPKEFIKKQLKCDRTEAVSNRSTYSPDWSLHQVRAFDLFNYIGESLDDWLHRGIARRFALGDPAELVRFVSLDARFAWMFSRDSSPCDEYTKVWDVLRGLAVKDFEVAQRFVETSTFPLKERHAFAALYNGVYATLRKDFDYLRAHVRKMRNLKPPAWIGSMYSCIIGIARRSPVLVAKGLDDVLDTFRRASNAYAIEKIICLNGHGLFSLSKWVSPKLVSMFDVERPLPWDVEFHRRVQDREHPLKGINLKGIPRRIRDAILTLSRPTWWDAPPTWMGTAIPADTPLGALLTWLGQR